MYISSRKVYYEMAKNFRLKNISEPENSALFLILKMSHFKLEHLYKFKRLITGNKLLISRRSLQKSKLSIHLRLRHYPLQYIFGEWFFRDFIVYCTPPVLIPRIETEMIVDIVKKQLSILKLKKKENYKFRLLEVGVGSGVIFISLMRFDENIECVGIDSNKKCIELSTTNMKRNLNFPEKITLKTIEFEDFSKSQKEKFDFLVSNPPYIKLENKGILMKDVINFESHKALFSGVDGLDLIRSIILQSRKLVKEGGFVVLEIDPDQKSEIMIILIKNKITNFFFEKDIFQKIRFLIYFI
jgi:release factor glutamine methyltransferase